MIEIFVRLIYRIYKSKIQMIIRLFKTYKYNIKNYVKEQMIHILYLTKFNNI